MRIKVMAFCILLVHHPQYCPITILLSNFWSLLYFLSWSTGTLSSSNKPCIVKNIQDINLQLSREKGWFFPALHTSTNIRQVAHNLPTIVLPMSSRSHTTWITRPTIKPTRGFSIRPISPSKPPLAQLLQLHFCLRSFHAQKSHQSLPIAHPLHAQQGHIHRLIVLCQPKDAATSADFSTASCSFPPSKISDKTGASWLPALQGHLPLKLHGKTVAFSLPPKCRILCLKVELLPAIASCTDCPC